VRVTEQEFRGELLRRLCGVSGDDTDNALVFAEKIIQRHGVNRFLGDALTAIQLMGLAQKYNVDVRRILAEKE